MKVAIDITLVYVPKTEDYRSYGVSEILSKLHSGSLIPYGETIYNVSGKPIFYVCDKDYQAPQPTTDKIKEDV